MGSMLLDTKNSFKLVAVVGGVVSTAGMCLPMTAILMTMMTMVFLSLVGIHDDAGFVSFTVGTVALLARVWKLFESAHHPFVG